MSAAAGAALAGEGGDVAQAASDSKGFNVALVIGALAVGYGIYRYMGVLDDTAEDVREGAGGAGRAAGSFIDDLYNDLGGVGGDVNEQVQENVDGTQDVVSDGMDWWFGGGADTVENVGREAGEGYEYVAGGLQDTIDGAGDAVSGFV